MPVQQNYQLVRDPASFSNNTICLRACQRVSPTVNAVIPAARIYHFDVLCGHKLAHKNEVESVIEVETEGSTDTTDTIPCCAV